MCKYPELGKLTKEIPDALATLRPIRKTALFLRMESKLQSDMAVFVWFCTELAHIFFLTEPLSFLQSVSILRNKNREIETVYRFVGLADWRTACYPSTTCGKSCLITACRKKRTMGTDWRVKRYIIL